IYDLTERVIPSAHLEKKSSPEESLRVLLLLALQGHGWAQTGTLANTWRLRNRPKQIAHALHSLVDDGSIVRCALVKNGKRVPGWIRTGDLERAGDLAARRLRHDRGILLSPFDPLIWDRARVQKLFGFEQVLEIFKPAPARIYGYYCLPVLAGERLVGRVDLKADRKAKQLNLLSVHLEESKNGRDSKAAASRAMQTALERYAKSLRLTLHAPSGRGGRVFE
ncbi:MAG TPA: crosslink repair DNA glycosylase YcaQ family protein, partial [bacterium]|nr:crosslink repair DNA glycosylase YcaQ family protein [bacterium]